MVAYSYVGIPFHINIHLLHFAKIFRNCDISVLFLFFEGLLWEGLKAFIIVKRKDLRGWETSIMVVTTQPCT